MVLRAGVSICPPRDTPGSLIPDRDEKHWASATFASVPTVENLLDFRGFLASSSTREDQGHFGFGFWRWMLPVEQSRKLSFSF